MHPGHTTQLSTTDPNQPANTLTHHTHAHTHTHTHTHMGTHTHTYEKLHVDAPSLPITMFHETQTCTRIATPELRKGSLQRNLQFDGPMESKKQFRQGNSSIHMGKPEETPIRKSISILDGCFVGHITTNHAMAHTFGKLRSQPRKHPRQEL